MRTEDATATRRMSRVLGVPEPGEPAPAVPRPVVSRRAVAAAVLVALLAVAVACFRGLTADGGELEPLPERPVAPSAPALTTPALPSAAPSATPMSGTVLVHVVGQVRRPGVVRLDPGARVADALTAAGGATPGADLTAVNLARPITDGEQLVVPKPGEPAAPAAAPPARGASPSPGAAVDLNTASESDLDALPGIGPVIAARIIAWRDQHGRFTSVDELTEVTGIGDATLTRLRPLVRV